MIDGWDNTEITILMLTSWPTAQLRLQIGDNLPATRIIVISESYVSFLLVYFKFTNFDAEYQYRKQAVVNLLPADSIGMDVETSEGETSSHKGVYMDTWIPLGAAIWMNNERK